MAPETLICEPMSSVLAAGASNEMVRQRYANLLGVAIEALDMEQALAAIARRLRQGPRGYVCFADVHGILEALKSTAVAAAYEHAAMVMPDGTPTMWVGRAQGLTGMECVTGPGLMAEVFRRREFARYSHFFYGGEPGVAGELASTLHRQFPWARIAGVYTPPFRDLTEGEEEELAAEVQRLKPDMVWVGISTPRQDLWMQRMMPRLQTRMIFGVGAAFDFLTGRIRLCPAWMKRAGLHWLHRLAQDPARLWRRNVKNTAFLWHIALQLSGARRYPMLPRAPIAEPQMDFVEVEAVQPEMAGSPL